MRARILLAVAVAAIAGLAFGAARLQLYVKEDPRFCASCHQMTPEFALWATGQHGAVACQKCHHSSTEEGLVMLRAFLAGTRPGGGRLHAAPEIGACQSCHLAHDKSWRTIGASRGHRIHAVDGKISCVRCHAAAAHRFEPVATTCRECHREHRVPLPEAQKLQCLACHDFVSAEATLRATRRE